VEKANPFLDHQSISALDVSYFAVYLCDIAPWREFIVLEIAFSCKDAKAQGSRKEKLGQHRA
jgi:hypothetical protein